MGPPGLEPGTNTLWVYCSNQLSYRPKLNSSYIILSKLSIEDSLKMVGRVGYAPTTPAMSMQYSTIELTALKLLKITIFKILMKRRFCCCDTLLLHKFFQKGLQNETETASKSNQKTTWFLTSIFVRFSFHFGKVLEAKLEPRWTKKRFLGCCGHLLDALWMLLSAPWSFQIHFRSILTRI